MTLSEKQRKLPLMVADLIAFAYRNGFELTFGEAYRTEEQQRIYLEKGLSRTMNSMHRDRLAIDFNLFINGGYVTDPEMYRPLGEEWERLGGRWGGRFGSSSRSAGWDANHFEYSD